MIPAVVQTAGQTNGMSVTGPLLDIKEPIDLAILAPWMQRTIPVLCALALLGWIWWRRRTSVPTREEVRESAAARARARLSAAWDSLEQPDRFCTSLSEIVRVYLEERFGLRAPDQTTEEFLEGLRESIALDLRHKAMLGEFLSQCDLVKFARGEPGRADLERLHQMASGLVEETSSSERVPGMEASK